MKEELINNVLSRMQGVLDWQQMKVLKVTLQEQLSGVNIQTSETTHGNDTHILLDRFITAKKIEGCSNKSMRYYHRTIELFAESVKLPITQITTMHIRDYLVQYQNLHQCSKVTVDNMRRILSSFFAWLEDEDYIVKSPVRRIHKVKTESYIKETLSDEELEKMRDCSNSLRHIGHFAG